MAVTCHTAPGRPRHGWTKARREALVAYVEQLMAVLKLSEWHVTIDLASDSGDAYAQVHLVIAQQNATLELSPSFLDFDPVCQRDTLVHELLHLHLNPIADLSSQLLGDALDGPLVAMHERGVLHDIEGRVDVLACAVGALLDPPDFDG